MKQYKFTKFFYFNILIITALLVSILYIFNYIDKKSDKLINHRTALVKEIYLIKYKAAESHLWFSEYLSGDIEEKSKLESIFKEIENGFEKLIRFEKNKAGFHQSKHRKNRFILEELIKLQKEFLVFKKTTQLHIKNKVVLAEFDDKKYDLQYQKFMNNMLRFDLTMHKMFLKINKEFKDLKSGIYLLILSLFLLTLFISHYLYRNEKKNIERILKQDKLIGEQYKLAAMGEMIDAIAHQWKSPLGVIRMKSEMLQYDLQDGTVTDEKIIETTNSSIKQVDHLNNTLDEFRKFFRPTTDLEFKSLQKMIDSTLVLLKDELVKNTISIDIKIEKDFQVEINENEFKHVLINLLQNSRDAFNEKNIQNRKVIFTLFKEADSIVLKISDNAGGIPTKILSDIFKPHFTTKTKTNVQGTGIGLYLSKQIVEKYHAQITVVNENGGASFFIKFPIYKL